MMIPTLSGKCQNLQMITKFARVLETQDDITELQEGINKLVGWANKWEINFKIYKCTVMHIKYNNMQSNYNMQSTVVANCSTARSRNHHHQRLQV